METIMENYLVPHTRTEKLAVVEQSWLLAKGKEMDAFTRGDDVGIAFWNTAVHAYDAQYFTLKGFRLEG